MDASGWYRVIYLSKVGNTIYMLHSFVKKSARTSRKDLQIAPNRLKAVKARLWEEKKNAGKKK
jgi:phage-related protein